MRIYQAWKTHNDKKYFKIKHLLEPDAVVPEEGEVDLEGLDQERPQPQSRAQSQAEPTPLGEPQPETQVGRPWNS